MIPIPSITSLTTARLLLRVSLPSDAAAVFAAEAESMEELRRWFWWCHPEHSRERSAVWANSREEAWRKGEEFSFLIFEREGRLIGCIWLNEIDLTARRASLGYWLRTDCAGRGLASEAARAVVDWAFAAGFERIQILTAVNNERSQRLIERLGATAEGIAPGRLRVGGEVQDARVYALIRPPVKEN